MAVLQVRFQAHHRGVSRSYLRHVSAEHSGCNDTSLYGGHSICQTIPSQETHSNIALQSKCRYMPERRLPVPDVPCWRHAQVPHRGGSRPGPAHQEEGTMTSLIFYIFYSNLSRGLGVACWPLVPKFAGSNPAEAVGFLGRKNPQHAFLRRGSKAAGPMS